MHAIGIACAGLILAAGGAEAATEMPSPRLGLAYLLDADARLDLAAARAADAAGGFHALPADEALNLGFTDVAVWLRAETGTLPADGAPWYLELTYAPLDELRAYVLRDGRLLAEYAVGETMAMARPIPHRYPVLPLPAGGPVTVYLRVHSEGAVQLPLRLLPADAFAAEAATDNAFYAGYFAALGTMLLYNGFLWLAIRDRSYLHYVGYLAAFGALQFHVNGYMALFWPTGAASFGNPLLLLLLALTEAVGTLFVLRFLDTGSLLPRLHRFLRGTVWACVAAGLLGLLLPYSLVLKMLLALAAVILVALPTAIVSALRAGRREARFLVLAITALAPGCATIVLRTFGLLPNNFITEHLMELSTALEMVLLSFALADRINSLQADQRRAEQALQRSAREHSERLVRSLEAERRRVAGELHDSIGQNLLVIGNQLNRLRTKAAVPALDDALGEAAGLARETVQEVRAIAHRLYPQQLARLGLKDALAANLKQAFAPSSIALHLDLPETLPSLSPEASAHLFLIAQEAASNTLRHSGARNCWIELTADARGLRLSVIDDGSGGAVDRARNGDGMGLSGQHERARLLGAEFAIAERAGGGTRLELLLPLGDRT